MKLVNGHPTRAVFDIANNEPQPITIHVVTGSLWTLKDMPGAPHPPIAVRNLTVQRYGVEVPAGEKESLTYSFATELHPQDLNLALVMMLQGRENEIFTKVVFNETVSVVEAPVSLFDPQMYVPPTPSHLPYLYVLTLWIKYLPLPIPRRSLRRDMLLHLQHLDHNLIPAKAARRQRRRAS